MRKPLCLLVLVLVVSSDVCEAARILGVWPMAARSHYILGNKLLKNLAAKGHEVTMISTFGEEKPVVNYRDVVVTGSWEALSASMQQDKKIDFLPMGDLPAWKQFYLFGVMGSKATEIALDHPDVQKLLNDPKEKFDLIIIEMFYTEVLYGLAHKFNAPVIVLSTLGSSTWTNHLVANPAPSSYIPDFFTTFLGHMTLYERIYNSVLNIWNEAYRRYVYFPKIDEIMHKFFPDAPSIFELMYKKTAMVLLNSHPSISEAKPHVPAMVEVGGFHVEDAKPLPKDLKEYMDNAPNGVILFSMGSNLRSVDLDDKTRDHILKAFRKLKQKVIWKWEDDNLPGKPSNVKIMKWCPQNDIMAHPNLRIFITHGGLLSTTEAVYHGVPVIAFPIFGDQKMNAALVTRKGFGLSIEYAQLTEERLSAALNEVLTNKKYKEETRKVSQILRGQPIRPIDAAVFWVEHVLQHRGADHLRTAAMDLSWYEIYSLDIVGIIALVNVIIFAILYYICKKICCAKKRRKDLGLKKKNN